MKNSTEQLMRGALGRARLGYVLQPQELVTSVMPQLCFAQRPTMALRLSNEEFNEACQGMQSCATTFLAYKDVLFALLLTDTASYRHLGVMDMSDPASYAAAQHCTRSGAINVGVTNEHGKHHVACLCLGDAFAAAMEQGPRIRKQTIRAQLLQTFRALAKVATQGRLVPNLGIAAKKKRTVSHLLLPLADDLFAANGNLTLAAEVTRR